MADKEPIVFQSEDSLWQMLLSGEKTFDMRRWDLGDDRIERLSCGHVEYPDAWVPAEPTVSFQNKATGEILNFEYLGVEFTPWAPNWGFILLGDRLMEGGN